MVFEVKMLLTSSWQLYTGVDLLLQRYPGWINVYRSEVDLTLT